MQNQNQSNQPKQEKTAVIAGYVKFAETKEGQSGPYRRCRIVYGKGDDSEWVTVRIPLKLLEETNTPDPEKGDFIKVTGLLTVFGEPGETYVFAQAIDEFISASELPEKPSTTPSDARGPRNTQSQGQNRPAPRGGYQRGNSGYQRTGARR